MQKYQLHDTFFKFPFPSLKENIVAWLEFELAIYDIAA